MPRSTLKLSPVIQKTCSPLGKVLCPIWRGLCRVLYWLSVPPRLFGRGLLWCFRWVGLLWRMLPQCVQNAAAHVYDWKLLRVVRMLVFVVACVLFWVLLLLILLLILFLCGAFGPLIRNLAPPIARSVGYELAIQACVVKPLSNDICITGLRLDTADSPRIGTAAPLVSLDSFRCNPLDGYLRIDNFNVGNPDTFHYAEDGDDYYAKNPLLNLALAELKVDIDPRTSNEIVIELIRVHGLNVLYALDYGTDNVTALTAQLVPAKEETEAASASETASEPAPAPEAQASSVEQPAEDTPQTPPPDVRVLLADFKDNKVNVRWVIAGTMPTTIPCPIPNFVLEDMGTQEVKEQVDSIMTPIRAAIDTANAAIDRTGKAVGALIDTTSEVLGTAGGALGEGAKAVSERTGSLIGDALNFFSKEDKE